jgi:hypothetical protein
MNITFNKATLKMLLHYGWSHDRQINTTDYEKHFANTKQISSPTIIGFLESFGGLNIKGLQFDPIEAHRVMGDIGSHYKEWVDKPLCLVGIWNQSAVLMSSTGELYSSFSSNLQLWGLSIGQAVDNMLTNKNPVEIPMPEAFKIPQPIQPSPPPEGRNFGIQHNNDWTPIFRPIRVKGIDLVMCNVPRGSFQMGRDDGSYRSRPKHEQYMIQSYWLSVNLVTNRQWRQAVEQSAGTIKEPKYLDMYNNSDKSDEPVVWIDWYQCQDFVSWLGNRWRLLTEAEWEFAARGPDNLIDPFNGHKDGISWVGSQDMGGNLWEWTASIFKIYPYNPSDGREEIKANGGRTTRNIGYENPSHLADATIRNHRLPTAPYKNIGFRVCITEIPVLPTSLT